MRLVMIVFISAATALSMLRLRAGLRTEHIGWMSEHWVQEHRLAPSPLDL